MYFLKRPMRWIYAPAFLLFALCSAAQAKVVHTARISPTKLELARDAHFDVHGSQIIGPDGSPFVIRGVNVSGSNWAFPHSVVPWAPLIADVWKFNTVRVNCNIYAPNGQYHDNDDLDALVRAFTQRRHNRVVVILTSHDKTGGFYTPSDTGRHPSLAELSAWFAALADKYKANPYVWFNVTNEPGPLAGNEAAWYNEHESVIRAIRQTGNLNPILADAAYWGQDINNDHFDRNDSAILTMGPRMVSEPYPYGKNIIFSIHLYTEWMRPADPAVPMAQFFDAARAQNLAVVVGEWAYYSWDGKTRTTIDVSKAANAFFKVGPQRGIGRIYWSWFGSDNPLCVQVRDPANSGRRIKDPEVPGWDDTGGGWRIDRSDGAKPGNLSPAGSLAWDDTHRRS